MSNVAAELQKTYALNPILEKTRGILKEAEGEYLDYPVLPEKALFGNVGKVVNAILPYTEADAAGLLIHLLTGFGAMIGRCAHIKVGQTPHYLNLFACVVGKTGQGKGTAWSEIKPLLRAADESFAKRIKSGLSSGEGLIMQVCDPVWKPKKKQVEGVPFYENNELVVPGVEDKRLLVIEEEFASLLQRMRREGNTLSAILREAWQSGDLRVMTKEAIEATGAHIGIIGHITREELASRLTDGDAANGFANRFIWTMVRSSKSLPDADSLPSEISNDLIQLLAEALSYSRTVTEMKRDQWANEFWHTIYEGLRNRPSGLLGEVTGRARNQVMRLAALYSLLEGKDIIEFEHLEAAYALWKYCEASARYIFGETVGDKNADKLYQSLQEAKETGLDRTQITKIFNGNLPAAEINRALQSLTELGKIKMVKQKGDGGRLKKVFYCQEYEINEFNEIS